MDDITRIQAIKRDTQLALRADFSGQVHKLRAETLVGRETECSIQIPSAQVSRYHAKISVSANGLFVEDLESSNGTFVNGKKIYQRTPIKLGDEICFDELRYKVVPAAEARSEVTRRSAGLLDAARSATASRAPAAAKPEALSEIKRQNRQHIDEVLKTPDISPPERGPQRPNVKLGSLISAKGDLPKPAGGNFHSGGGIGPVPSSPKAQEIDDIEAFLRFAGSGLKPQAPLPRRDASPFGLHKQAAKDSSSTQAIGTKTDELPLEPLPQKLDAKPSKTPKFDWPKAKEPFDGQSVASPGGGKASGTVARENISTSMENKKHQAKPAGPASKPAPSDEGEKTGRPQVSDSDDDQTKFLGLNAINQYVATNQQFQRDLEIGSGPRLIAMTAPIRGKVFTLASDEDVSCWSIGRDDSADICLRDKVVSREHAWITKLDSLYQLRVNETASGISVNGETRTEADLHHGDRLQLGTMELVFRLDVHLGEEDAEYGGGSMFAWLKKLFGGTH